MGLSFTRGSEKPRGGAFRKPKSTLREEKNHNKKKRHNQKLLNLGWSRDSEKHQATEHGSMALRLVALHGAAPTVPSCRVHSSPRLTYCASGKERVPQTLAFRPSHPCALSLHLLPLLSCPANPCYSSSLTVTPLPPGGLP